MSDFSEYLLPFDPYANQASNFLQNQSYSISNVGAEERQQIVPRHGAFYLTDDFKIVHQASNVVLKENTDYILSYFCREVYKATNTYAFGSIVLLNKSLYGGLLIDARYVGGDYGLPTDGLIPAIISYDKTEDTFIWEDVQDIPPEYPVDSHTISSKLLTTGFDDMVDVLKLINDSLTKIGSQTLPITIADVIGLQQELNNRIDNSGQSQVNRVSATLTYPGYIELVLPDLMSISRVGVTLDVVLKKGYYTFSIHGDAGTGLNTSPWENTYARIFGAARYFHIYTGYKNSKPAIYIGPFSEEQAPDKLLASLRHYIVDNIASDFTPEFSLAMVSAPTGLTDIAARYRSNDHTHPISSINGLEDWIASNENDVRDLANALSNTNQAVSDLNTELDQLAQHHADDMQTVGFTLDNLTQGLNTLSQTVTQNKQSADQAHLGFTNRLNDIDTAVEQITQQHQTDISNIDQRLDTISEAMESIGTAVTDNQQAAEAQYLKVATNATNISKAVNYLIKTEDAYKSASGTTLVFDSAELKTTKSYLVTLIGSLSDGDIYQSIVRYRDGSWCQAIVTMGLETPTTPVLSITSNTVTISCFNASRSDPDVTVYVRCIETVIKPS